MRRLTMAVDCDGVLGDFVTAALRIVGEVTGRRFLTSDVREKDFLRGLGLSGDEALLVRETVAGRRGFVTSIAPYPLARQGLRRLRELGDVVCVTRPWETSPWWEEERTSWLALHFGIDVVHYTSDKAGYEADVFVDDESSHVRAWLDRWPDRTAVFWRTVHNTAETVPWGAHSISSWESLYEIAREAALSERSTAR